MEQLLEMSTNLLAHMKALYGKRYIDQWKEVSEEVLEKMFAKAIADLTEDQIEYGYAKMFNQEWVPTIPQFRKWCCSYGLQGLSAYEAWLDALEYEQSNGSTDISFFTKKALLKLKKVYRNIDQESRLQADIFIECFERIKHDALISGEKDYMVKAEFSSEEVKLKEEREEHKPIRIPEDVRIIFFQSKNRNVKKN